MDNTIRLKDACKILNGFAFKSSKYVDSGIRIIRIANVQKGYVEDEKPAFYPDSEEPLIRDYMLEENDLLLSLTGNVGRVALLDKKWLPAALNQRVACLRIKDDRIIKDYLYFALLSDKFENDCIKSSKGIAQKNMSTEWLKDYEIPLPSEQRQREIVSSLKHLSAIIKNKTEQVRQLDNLIKARFVEMFGDKNFEARPFKDVCDELFAGGDVKKDRTVKEADSDHPYAVFTNGEKDGGLYGYTDIARVIKPSITISGRGTIGFCLVRTEPFYPAIRLIVATPKENLVTPSYLKYFIDSKDYNGRGASIPQLTIPMIKDEPVPIPPIELQNQFETFIAQINKSKFALSNELTMGNFYVRLIHDRVMHGRIDL